MCKECTSSANKKYRIEHREQRIAAEIRSRKKRFVEEKYRWVRDRAKKKKVPICSQTEFLLWYSLQKLECVYCHISEVDSLRKFYHRLHIDRLDPKLGYVVSNIQLACHRCNLTKNAYITHEQMMEIAERYFNNENI